MDYIVSQSTSYHLNALILLTYLRACLLGAFQARSWMRKWLFKKEMPSLSLHMFVKFFSKFMHFAHHKWREFKTNTFP